MALPKPRNREWQLTLSWLPPFLVPRLIEPGSKKVINKRSVAKPSTPTRRVPTKTSGSRELVITLAGKELALNAPRLPLPRLVKKAGPAKAPALGWDRQLVLVGVLVAGIIASLILGWRLLYANPPAPTDIPVAQATLPVGSQAEGLRRSAPTQLRIPKIGVNTSFIKLGVERDGTMEVPEQYDIAGWYKYAPTPGEIGPAVIVGHVDNYRGPAVFYRLGQLKPGDTVEITRADKMVVKFKVTRVKQFSQDNFPTKAVYDNIDHAGLRLITCGGQFDATSNSYTHNTIVFAEAI